MSQYRQRIPARRQRDEWEGGGGPRSAARDNLLQNRDGGVRHVRVAIVGSGFAGLCMAIKLRQAGIDDFVVLERGDSVGGTWRDNTYPGCACDVPSHLYSYSFEPELEWPRPYAEQADIRAYIERCTDKYGIRPFIQFGAQVSAAKFDESSARWTLETSAGELTADIFAPGFGGLSEPKIPDLPGLSSFRGRYFHSAQWDHDFDFTGKRVAVIGSGASTIQFLPRIAPLSHHLTLFQRSASWVLPKADRPFTPRERWLYRHLPPYRLMQRMRLFLNHEMLGVAFRRPEWMDVARRGGKRHIRQHIKDRALRKLLTPDYTPGCKRILLSNDFYPAIARDNVDVTGSPIREVRERSIVTEDGREIPVDVIVFGTGFDTQNAERRPHIVGRGGRTLAEAWTDGAEAYLGTLVTGFPNMILLGGPNAGLGHNSMIIMLEGAVRVAMKVLALMHKRGATTVEVRPEAQREFNEWAQKRLATTVWATGCSSYYLAPNGRNTAIWPGSAASYARATRKLRERDLELACAPVNAR